LPILFLDQELRGVKHPCGHVETATNERVNGFVAEQDRGKEAVITVLHDPPCLIPCHPWHPDIDRDRILPAGPDKECDARGMQPGSACAWWGIAERFLVQWLRCKFAAPDAVPDH